MRPDLRLHQPEQAILRHPDEDLHGAAERSRWLRGHRRRGRQGGCRRRGRLQGRRRRRDGRRRWRQSHVHLCDVQGFEADLRRRRRDLLGLQSGTRLLWQPGWGNARLRGRCGRDRCERDKRHVRRLPHGQQLQGREADLRQDELDVLRLRERELRCLQEAQPLDPLLRDGDRRRCWSQARDVRRLPFERELRWRDADLRPLSERLHGVQRRHRLQRGEPEHLHDRRALRHRRGNDLRQERHIDLHRESAGWERKCGNQGAALLLDAVHPGLCFDQPRSGPRRRIRRPHHGRRLELCKSGAAPQALDRGTARRHDRQHFEPGGVQHEQRNRLHSRGDVLPVSIGRYPNDRRQPLPRRRNRGQL